MRIIKQPYDLPIKRGIEVTAIIYDKRGRILSLGKNSYVKTHTLQGEYARKAKDPERIYLHAEIAAIVKCRDLSRAHRILVLRFGKNGEPRLAKPCKICSLAIEELTPIKKVEYTK